MKHFCSPLNPGRISALPAVAQCPGFAVLRMLDNTVGGAAHTGTAAGRLIELVHAGYVLEEAGRVVETESALRYPLADLELAMNMASAYAEDYRNQGIVVEGSCEQVVKLSLDPAPEDPTGTKIHLTGHLDQLRRGVDGQLRVWDVKAGRGPGLEMLYNYAWQLAGYALAVTETTGELCLPGGIIRVRGYVNTKRIRDEETNELRHKHPHECSVFFEAPWTQQQCRDMLKTFVQHVAWLRSGMVHLHPGLSCQWCPAGGPHLCAERIRESESRLLEK